MKLLHIILAIFIFQGAQAQNNLATLIQNNDHQAIMDYKRSWEKGWESSWRLDDAHIKESSGEKRLVLEWHRTDNLLKYGRTDYYDEQGNYLYGETSIHNGNEQIAKGKIYIGKNGQRIFRHQKVTAEREADNQSQNPYFLLEVFDEGVVRCSFSADKPFEIEDDPVRLSNIPRDIQFNTNQDCVDFLNQIKRVRNYEGRKNQ